jgi:hypothetical protein
VIEALSFEFTGYAIAWRMVPFAMTFGHVLAGALAVAWVRSLGRP